MSFLRFTRRLALIPLILALVACGSVENPEPTATPAPPTAAPGQLTVRDVLAMADEAWPTVESMRTTSRSGAVPTGEGEEPPFTGSVQDWTANGNRHIIEFQDGAAINEQVYVDGTIYMRGQFVSSAVAPQLDVNTWVILDPSVIPTDTPVGRQVEFLIREQTNPYGSFTEETLNRPVQEHGSVTVGERQCTLYTFGDETDTGTEIKHELAIDEHGLPCQLVQRAGDFQNSTIFEFNIEGVNIEAPLDGTPVSGTPEG